MKYMRRTDEDCEWSKKLVVTRLSTYTHYWRLIRPSPCLWGCMRWTEGAVSFPSITCSLMIIILYAINILRILTVWLAIFSQIFCHSLSSLTNNCVVSTAGWNMRKLKSISNTLTWPYAVLNCDWYHCDFHRSHRTQRRHGIVSATGTRMEQILYLVTQVKYKIVFGKEVICNGISLSEYELTSLFLYENTKLCRGTCRTG